MTKIIAGFPCIGKTTVGNWDKHRFMDLEFRETASARGMSKANIERLYDNYIEIIKNIVSTGYYEFLFVTDNPKMLDRLINSGLKITYVIPDPQDSHYINFHKGLVLNRDSEDWYTEVIEPRLENLMQSIEKVSSKPYNNILFLEFENGNRFLPDVINSNRRMFNTTEVRAPYPL